VKIETKEEFVRFFTAQKKDKPEIHGGFASAHWDGSAEVEAEIKEELKVTIRCIPFDGPEEDGVCVWSGRPSKRRVFFAKSY
jgi:prolyl-tRNA synthetase